MVEENLGRLLLRAFRWMDASMLATLQQRGWADVTTAQSMLFAHLDEDGTRPSELAHRIGVSRQAVHQTVRDLTEMGLVDLVPDPSDGRARIVTLTEVGRENVRAALGAFHDVENELADRIGERRVRALREALESDWGPPAAM